MKPNLYYASRAQAAYAAAEAADDPRDKAAYKAAARTWERLAKPVTGVTYSMEPYRQQMAALKRDVAEAIDAPASAPAVEEAVAAAAHGMSQDRERLRKIFAKKPVTIEF